VFAEKTRLPPETGFGIVYERVFASKWFWMDKQELLYFDMSELKCGIFVIINILCKKDVYIQKKLYHYFENHIAIFGKHIAIFRKSLIFS